MDLYEGAIVDVVVSCVRHFGVLVRFGDRDGLILETNISWNCDGVHQATFEMFNPGQMLRVKVLVITPKQFSASIKHVHPEEDPWWDPTIYVVGAVHRGVVKLIFDNGGAVRCATAHRSSRVDSAIQAFSSGVRRSRVISGQSSSE